MSSGRAKLGRGGVHSWRPKHVRPRAGSGRRVRLPVLLFVCAFAVAAGGAAVAYTTTSVQGSGQAQAVTLDSPGAGSAASPTATTLSLSWGTSSALPARGGYLVLRSTSPGGPFQKITSGTCQQSTTVVSAATSCTDSGLTVGTTYYYEVEAAYYDISSLWVSAPTAPFSATTSAAGITSIDNATFAAGEAGSFTVTTAGFSIPTLSDTGFAGCTPSTLPGTVAFTDDHDGTATLAGTPTATSAGTYTVCITASEAAASATQVFTLTVSQAQGPTGAPAVTSASSAAFFVGAASSFQATASGTPAPTFSDAPFGGCTPSTLPSGLTFSATGLLSGTPGADAVGTYTVCINAANGVGATGTQTFTLTIETESLVITSPGVSGAAGGTPNLGPITVRRQTGSGTPITTGALTVDLASSPSSGATFGTAQFAPPVTSVIIPAGQSSATFWYGSTATGTPTVTASAPGFTSGTQLETITTAPAGLGLALAAGSTGTPALSCGAAAATDTCNVTGVGAGGSAVLVVTFTDADQGPGLYSATQASVVDESGQDTGSVTIAAGASASSPQTLTAAVGTSTLTFGPYALTIDVSA
jgi:hypothetical protein